MYLFVYVIFNNNFSGLDIELNFDFNQKSEFTRIKAL